MVLTWEQLDACKTVADLVALLRQAGVRGRRYDVERCPLARATGWKVALRVACLPRQAVRDLTPVQRSLVILFDGGFIPELDEDAPRIH